MAEIRGRTIKVQGLNAQEVRDVAKAYKVALHAFTRKSYSPDADAASGQHVDGLHRRYGAPGPQYPKVLQGGT
jgi:hypothetical protein